MSRIYIDTTPSSGRFLRDILAHPSVAFFSEEKMLIRNVWGESFQLIAVTIPTVVNHGAMVSWTSKRCAERQPYMLCTSVLSKVACNGLYRLINSEI
jgi:hypothetical protein